MNSTFKRFAKWVSIAAIIALMFSLATVGVFAAKASDAKNSVVVVVSEDGLSYGSGFAIGKVGKPVEYIVTNNHVVRGDKGNTVATVYFSLASNKMMLANVYYYDKDRDIAVLKLPEPTTERQALVLCPMDQVDLDDTFMALGYPAGEATDWPKYNTDDITVTRGGIKKPDRINGQDVYMLDLKVTNGNSGGPLVNSAGEAVGINTFGIQIGDNSNYYAIAIDELLSSIDTKKIPVTLHGSLSLSPLLIAAIIIGGLILLLLLWLLFKKLHKKQDPPSDPPFDPNPPKGPMMRVICLGGALNGKKYELNGTVRIGRDPSKCQIAYPMNTKGVSAEHCELTFDGKVCYLKDLNSSYGTFRMDGSKMIPNVPELISSGTRFYLASTENTFEIHFPF